MVRIPSIACVLATGCSLFPDVGALNGADSGIDATIIDAAIDSGFDAGDTSDAGSDAPSCTCTSLVSAYQFSNTNSLGQDTFGHNDMTLVTGSPSQSPTTPLGLSGHSLQLDGSSTVCIPTGFTFDSTADHTLCWWTQPFAVANQTNQFAQQCNYDTWTTSSGADYLWHINNCNSGVAADLQVPNTYKVGTWVQICQTYSRAALERTVVLNGQTATKYSVVDSSPIVEDPGAPWCIGSYGNGGFWTGLIYLPLWFDRVLSDSEIQNVSAHGCCLP